MITTGNDIHNAGGLKKSINGLAGYDTLILNYASPYSGQSVTGFLGSPSQSGFSGITSIFSSNTAPTTQFYISNFERFDITGSSGRDEISTLAGNDIIRSGAGDDTLRGGTGSDAMAAGDGDDWIILDADGVVDKAFGGNGNDFFEVTDDLDVVYGGTGWDEMMFQLNGVASHAINIDLASAKGSLHGIEGFGGNLSNFSDTIIVFQLSSDLSGHGGQDRAFLDYSASVNRIALVQQNATGHILSSITKSGNIDLSVRISSIEEYRILGTKGNDTIRMGSNELLGIAAGNDTLSGGGGNDFISGASGIDRLFGGDGADTLFGGAGTDVLFGGEGNDTLIGGTGNDVLFGNIGADTFKFEGTIASGNDSIKDYARGIDKIWISGGLTQSDITITHGADFAKITWATGSVILTGYTSPTLHIYYDADFL